MDREIAMVKKHTKSITKTIRMDVHLFENLKRVVKKKRLTISALMTEILQQHSKDILFEQEMTLESAVLFEILEITSYLQAHTMDHLINRENGKEINDRFMQHANRIKQDIIRGWYK